MKRKILTVLVAIAATAMFVIPGIAIGKNGGGGGGGNGTPSPPPSNPPCDSDGHLLDSVFQAKHKQCNDGGGSTGHGTNATTNPPCDSDNHLVRLPKGLEKKCPSSTSTSSSSSSSSSTTTTTTTATTTPPSDVCETDGLLGTKGLGVNSPDDRTIGQIVWDELALVVQDPQIPGGGPLSQPLYDGLIGIPLGGLETPVAAEVGCLLNNLSL